MKHILFISVSLCCVSMLIGGGETNKKIGGEGLDDKNKKIIVSFLKQPALANIVDPCNKNREASVFSSKEIIEQFFSHSARAKRAIKTVLINEQEKKNKENLYLEQLCEYENLSSKDDLKNYLIEQKEQNKNGFWISALIFTGSCVAYCKWIDSGKVGGIYALISAGGMLFNGYEWLQKQRALRSLQNVERAEKNIELLKLWKNQLEGCGKK